MNVVVIVPLRKYHVDNTTTETKLCYLEVLVEGRLYGDFTLVRTSLRQKDTGPERGTRAER